MHPAPSESLLDAFEVSFSGPPMIRRTRGALSAAAITPLVDRHNGAVAMREGASKLHEFVVAVQAGSAGQAVERTRAAVEAGGAYTGFSAAPRPAAPLS